MTRAALGWQIGGKKEAITSSLWALVVPNAAVCMRCKTRGKKKTFPNEPKVLGRALCLSAKALCFVLSSSKREN